MASKTAALYDVLLSVIARDPHDNGAIVANVAVKLRIIALDEDTAARAARDFARNQHFRLTRFRTWPERWKIEIGSVLYVTPEPEALKIDGIFEPILRT